MEDEMLTGDPARATAAARGRRGEFDHLISGSYFRPEPVNTPPGRESYGYP
jgi:hypothetical protein